MTYVNVDQLTADFVRAISICYTNDTPFDLIYDNDTRKVYTRQSIGKGARIGYIPGTQRYIWDITHSEYMFVNDDMVIDVSELYPRPLSTLIANENDSWNDANLVMFMEHDDIAKETLVCLYALCDITAGSELVYKMEQYF